MTRGVLAVTVVVLAIPACGARTGLDGTAGAGAHPGGGVGLTSACNAAVQSGAPTPMPDYCPTHAAQASATGPRSPHLVWTAQPFPIQSPEDYLPPWMVVDASGRTYVVFDDSPQKNFGSSPSTAVSALDPDGNTLFTKSLPGRLANLFLDRDGILRFTGAGDGSLDPSGASAGALQVPPVPSKFGPLELFPTAIAPAFDGGLYLAGELFDAHGDEFGAALAHLMATGALQWSWPATYDPQDMLQLSPPLLVSQDGAVVLSSSTGLLGFDASGDQTWQLSPSPSNAAFDAQGRFVTLVPASTGGLDLVTTDPAGGEVARAAIPPPTVTPTATRLALAGDGSAVVLLSDETPSPGQTKAHVTVLALDPSGTQRWSTPLDATLAYDPAATDAHYGLFVDGAGTVGLSPRGSSQAST